MRATLRITWLLLSLSSLLPRIYSDDTSTMVAGNTTTSDAGAKVSTPPDVSAKATKATISSPETGAATSAPPTVPATTMPTVTTTKSNAADTNPVTTLPTIPAANNTTPSPSQTVTDLKNQTSANPPVPPSTVVSTTSLPKISIQAETTSRNNILTSATVQTQSDSATTKIPTMPDNLPGSDGVKSTTMAPGPSVSTAQTPGSFIFSATVTSQENSSKGVNTDPTTAHGPMTSEPTRMSATPGVTITSTIQAVAGLTTAGLSDTQTGTTGLPANTTNPPPGIYPPAQPYHFSYTLNNGEVSNKDKNLMKLCQKLMPKWQSGNCTLTYQKQDNKIQFEMVEINGKVSIEDANSQYEDITKKAEQTDNKTLIAILASCGALLIMIVILAVCASHHRKPYNENQQHLTEELNTVENGYHDNPTLEVMEVQPEMQEKKLALNGEFNDSWIVPIDNLMKDDIPDEEDTHL